MHCISIALNKHDSCITIANETNIILHLELERFFRVKHYCVNNISILFSMISLLIQDYSIDGEIVFILSQHKDVNLNLQVLSYIHKEYPNSNVYEVDHLDAHAALCYLSGLEEALVVAMDGGGDRRISVDQPNFLVYLYKNNSLELLNGNSMPRFDGRVWSVVSKKQFNEPFAAGKTMGLAAYGEFSSKHQDVLLGKNFVHIDDIWRNQEKLSYLLSQLDIKDFEDSACLAYTLQTLYSENIISTLKEYRSYSDNIVLTGGCAFNVVTNNLIGECLNYKNVYVPPCPGDEGQSLGALLHYFGMQGLKISGQSLPYLGQGHEHDCISESALKKIVSLIIEQKTVAWHMGKAEIGPRALGHRSLIAMPTKQAMKVCVSEAIKKRESFRPIAPVVLEEYASEWFDFKFPSPYMSFAVKAKENAKKLAPAIVHVDGTSRLQTLSKHSNPALHELISRIYEITGIPILINTSLNTASLPICNIEQDSKDFYISTSVDSLNLNGVVYSKRK